MPNDFPTEFQIDRTSVSDAEFEKLEKVLQLPLFTSSDHQMCPLTYLVSRKPDAWEEVTEVVAKYTTSSVQITVPLSYDNSLSVSLYLVSTNSVGVTFSSPLISISASPVCRSFLAQMGSNGSIEKEFALTLYQEDFGSTTFEWNQLAKFIEEQQVGKWPAKYCGLQTPAIGVEGLTPIVDNRSGSRVFKISEFVELRVPGDLVNSSFIISQTPLGFLQTSASVEIKDKAGATLSLKFKFEVCGKNYWGFTCLKP